jgi:putative addiction module component (TIGR02574 family)
MSTKKPATAKRPVEELKPRLARLSARERAELAHFLILSLNEGSDEDANVAWDAELDRRAAEIESGQTVGEPASKVFEELRDKFR